MNKLMCHVVAGYPDDKTCLELMQGMDKAGVCAIEVQIPFSDPIADGETIMRANDVALEGGMTTAKSFDLIRKADLACDVYIMSYIQKVLHFGFGAFCKAAAESGAKGLIIPDLPHDSPEHKELAKSASNLGLELVPVLTPGMPKNRAKARLSTNPEHVYVTSQHGITGNAYVGNQNLKNFVAFIRKQSDATVMIGFGIRSVKDIEDALKIGDIAVIGSAIINVRGLKEGSVREALDFIERLALGRAGS